MKSQFFNPPKDVNDTNGASKKQVRKDHLPWKSKIRKGATEVELDAGIKAVRTEIQVPTWKNFNFGQRIDKR